MVMSRKFKLNLIVDKVRSAVTALTRDVEPPRAPTHSVLKTVSESVAAAEEILRRFAMDQFQGRK